jgi:hypothetical protein
VLSGAVRLCGCQRIGSLMRLPSAIRSQLRLLWSDMLQGPHGLHARLLGSWFLC